MRRIAFSTLCFSNRSLEEALAAAAELGLADVDLGMLEGWVHVNPSRVRENEKGCIAEVKKLCAQSGTRVVALNGVMSDAPTQPGGSDRLLAETAAVGRFARALGAEVLTIQPGGLPPKEEMNQALGVAAENLNRMEEILDKHLVRLLIEPHDGGLCIEPENALRLVRTVPGLEIAYDPSHFICCGIPLEQTADLFPHVGHVHLRDAVRGALQADWGKGTVDFEWVIGQLESVSYQRTVSIEYIGSENAIENIEGLRDWLEERWMGKSVV
jgi:sugar phosphate isomerase/epimerase